MLASHVRHALIYSLARAYKLFVRSNWQILAALLGSRPPWTLGGKEREKVRGVGREMFTYVSLCIPMYVDIYLSFSFFFLPVYPSISLSTYPSIYPCMHSRQYFMQCMYATKVHVTQAGGIHDDVAYVTLNNFYNTILEGGSVRKE